MIELKKWSGSFVEDGHRYFRADGKELKGVTGILHRRIFMDEYKGVPQEVLDNAARRGSMIHSRVQLFDIAGIGTDMPEVEHYRRLKEDLRLEHMASEYLVSDDEYYASAIDKVYHEADAPDNEIVLGDIKTTSKFNREYVSWQLSVYAYFFEQMNPDLVVSRLYGIWLREDKVRGSIAKFIPIERKPVELVRELLRCDIEDKPFTATRIPSYIAENIDQLIYINEQIKALTEEKEQITETILDSMKKGDVEKVDVGSILFTRKAGGVRSTFDSKRFKEEHEDMYDEYLKSSEVKESLTIKFRD